jgi:geranylgeranyl diphosphate synthase type II
MSAEAVLEAALERAVERADRGDAPFKLAAALRHAVFPGGARVRPRLCLAVAQASGSFDRTAAFAAAVSIELLHCASLVHDDLPCFDDADLRRGLPSVHAAYGEPIAVLAGDALIVLAFDTLATAADLCPQRALAITRALARSAGSPYGIAAGQAWEGESRIDIEAYQRAKTGALFIAACQAGALAGGGTPASWTRFGDDLGLAYQAADDLRDVLCRSGEIGKPTGKDTSLGRPSVVAEAGVAGAIDRLRTLAERAKDAIPACPGRLMLRSLVDKEMARLVPQGILERAA